MQTTRIGTTIIMTPRTHLRTLVWLHGLGDSAQGFYPLFQSRPLLPDCKFILLTAPRRKVTINFGVEMNSWYDITSLDKRQFHPQVIQSADIISEVLQKELQYTRDLFLGGFSQGAAMSLFTGLRHFSQELSGIVALSGYALPFQPRPDRMHVPTFLYNGLHDDLVRPEMAETSFQMNLQGCNLTKHTEQFLGHEVSPKEIECVIEWLNGLIS